MILHPENVHVLRTRHVQRQSFLNRWRRPRILPLVDLRMAIGESKACGTPMIAGRVIHYLRAADVWITIHLRHKISVVNAILPLVQQHKSHRRSRLHHVDELAEDLPLRSRAPKTSVVGRSVTVSSHPIAHSHAPHAWNTVALRINTESGIRRTVPDLRLISAILPHWALANGLIQVPIARCP